MDIRVIHVRIAIDWNNFFVHTFFIENILTCKVNRIQVMRLMNHWLIATFVSIPKNMDNKQLDIKKTNSYLYIKAVQSSGYEGKAETIIEAKILDNTGSQIEAGVDGDICDPSDEVIADGIESLYNDKQFRLSFMNHCQLKDYSNGDELIKLNALFYKFQINESANS